MSVASSLQSRVERTGGITVVHFAGELDIEVQSEARAVLADELTRADTTWVVADLAAVTYFDSTAVAMLVHAYRTALTLDRRLTIRNATAQVRHVLRVTGLLDLLDPD